MTLNAYRMDTSSPITELLCSEYVVEQRYCKVQLHCSFIFIVDAGTIFTLTE